MYGISPCGGGHHQAHYQATGWVIHKLENSYTKEVFVLLQTCQTPQKTSQPGDLAKGLRIPSDSDFEGQQDLMTNLDNFLRTDILLFSKKSTQSNLWFFQQSCVDVRVGPYIRLIAKAFMLSNWAWKKLLRVLWIARRSKQSILKEINPEYSLEGLMLKLKLQYFGHLT